MSTAFPDHGRSAPPSISLSATVPLSTSSYSVPASRESQSDREMEEAVRSRTSRRSAVADTTGVETTRAASTDDESLGPVRKDGSGGVKQLDKQSLDYVLRSGLAGGMAGCAVSLFILSTIDLHHCGCRYLLCSMKSFQWKGSTC